MKHLDLIDEEFTRQAGTFAESAALNSPEVIEPIAAALGDLPAGRVLDVACGPGILTGALGARAASAIGLDFTAETLRRARSRWAGSPRTAFVRGLAERAPFPAHAFAGAVIRLALHHFDDPHAILQEVHRVLEPGGRLVVLDILTSARPEESRLHNAIERLRDPSHATFVDESQLAERIRSAGFEIATIDTWEKPRRFADWAAVVNAPQRTAALETLLRHLVRGGETAGIALREVDGEVWFTYAWALVLATAA